MPRPDSSRRLVWRAPRDDRHHLDGDATWTDLDAAVGLLSVVGPSTIFRRPDDEADALARLLVAVKGLGPLLVCTDDGYLGTALRDTAACLGWQEVTASLADALEPRPATASQVAALFC